jgi:DNA-directed RNA polymerase subunit alpha
MRGLLFERPGVANLTDGSNPYVASYSIKPLDRGYATTLGTALRRVLLASNPGAGIVNIKIDGVKHEFSTIKGVHEDVMHLLQNIKKIILSISDEEWEGTAYGNLENDRHLTLRLHAEGEGEVLAGDLDIPAGVSIINPELHLCTLTEKDAVLDFDCWARKGSGYVDFDRNKIHLGNEVGRLPLDALYAPVNKVGVYVEKLRDDYEELILDLETNGAITADDAIGIAGRELVDLFGIFTSLSSYAVSRESSIKTSHQSQYTNNRLPVEQVEQPIEEKNIDTLQLASAVTNILHRAGYNTIGELIAKTRNEIQLIKGLGKDSINSIISALNTHQVAFAEKSEESEEKE